MYALFLIATAILTVVSTYIDIAGALAIAENVKAIHLHTESLFDYNIILSSLIICTAMLAQTTAVLTVVKAVLS